MVTISVLSFLSSFDSFSQIVSPLYQSTWISDLFHQYCSTAFFACIDESLVLQISHFLMNGICLCWFIKIFGAVVWTNVGRYLFTFIECSSTLCAVFCIDEFSSSNQFFLNGSHESTLLYDISIFLAVVCMDEFSFANGVCLMNGMRPYAFITQAYFVR